MKLFFIILISVVMSGCSLLPKLNFNTPNTVPQSVDKSKSKNICKGEAKFNDIGEMVYCSEGYYLYSEGYEKKERKMTIIERVKSFVNGLKGWSFWIFVGLIFLFPGLLGAIGGRLIEATIGITGRALRATVRGVQRARKSGKDLDDALSSEQDKKEKEYIEKVKKQEKLK